MYCLTGVSYDQSEIPGGQYHEREQARKQAHIMVGQAGIYLVKIEGPDGSEIHETLWRDRCQVCLKNGFPDERWQQ